MPKPDLKIIPWLTAQMVRDILSYDPTTGIFRWRHACGLSGRIPAGSVAGSIQADGYRRVGFGNSMGAGCTVTAGVLAWLYVTGDWPTRQIDHRNGNRDANWWDNLRLATSPQNGANRKKSKNNTSGFHGVAFVARNINRPWRAWIGINGKLKAIGSFATQEEAVAARKAAEVEHHGEFVRKDRA